MVSGLGCRRKMVGKSSTQDEQREGKDLPYEKLKHASFDKSERLLLKSDFSAVFNAPSGRLSTNPLRILYKENGLGVSRIGIIVPKKVVRLATARNRHKRLIREQFRQVKTCLPNVDIVLLLNKKVGEKDLIMGCDWVWKSLIIELDD